MTSANFVYYLIDQTMKAHAIERAKTLAREHTTVNGVNTVNMVNGTVNIGDFNAKNARSTHQDADESTLGLRG